MKRNLLIILVCSHVVGACWALSIQFTSEEINQRQQWEGFLKTAELAAENQLGGGNVKNAPWRLQLVSEDLRQWALWKNPLGELNGYQESWKWEIAAYRLDKHLGVNMVPPTVERELRGNRGCCQLWVTAEMDMAKQIREKIPTPVHKAIAIKRALSLQRTFDNLIANFDRHKGTILLTKDWRLILIDHSRSFSISEESTMELLYTEWDSWDTEGMRPLPRTFVEKLRGLSFDAIKQLVEEYLTDAEIEAVLTRRDLILQEIDRLIKRNGEDRVLY